MSPINIIIFIHNFEWILHLSLVKRVDQTVRSNNLKKQVTVLYGKMDSEDEKKKIKREKIRLKRLDDAEKRKNRNEEKRKYRQNSLKNSQPLKYGYHIINLSSIYDFMLG